MASSRFVEILDDNSVDTTSQQHRMSECDVKLEDVLADQEQQRSRSRSSTQSSSRSRKSQEYDPRTSTSRDESSPASASSSPSSSPSSSNATSPTSAVPRIKRLRKFTLTGGFSR